MKVRSWAAAVGALLVPAASASAQPSTQQVLLPDSSRYPTQSPPLITAETPPPVYLPSRVTANSAQRVVAGVEADGRVVSARVRQRLVLSGKGDYQIVVAAPAEDVRAAPGSDSEPGLRAGQILWAGFSPGRKVLGADAVLRPAAAESFLPLRLSARRDGDRYTLTVTNATSISEVAYSGTGVSRELASLLDQTRRQSLAGERLSTAYATIAGLIRQRKRPARIAAPLWVEGVLRFPQPVASASGGVVRGNRVSFDATLGDGRPMSLRIEVRGGGGAPKLRLVARPAKVVRQLKPSGARTWTQAQRRHPLPARLLLERLIEARMALVRADQFESFLSNPDPQGRSRTVYVYETTAAPRRPEVSASAGSGSGGGDALVIALAIAGSLLAAGTAVVVWAHS